MRAVRLGFAAAPEEAMLGINAVAAPIFDDRDSMVSSNAARVLGLETLVSS